MKLGLYLGWKWVLIPFAFITLAFAGCSRSPEAKSARYIQAGKTWMQKRDAARAILEFRNAVQAAPKNDEAYYQLSMALLAQRDYPGAVKYLRQTISLNPKHTSARLRLAELMTGARDPKILADAQQRLNELLAGDSNNPESLHALALTELKLGDPSDALQHLETAFTGAGGNSQGLPIALTLAQAKLQQKDVKGAEEVLKRACEQSSAPAEALTYLGQFYLSQGREVDAEQQFQKAVSADPRSGVPLYQLASLQLSLGRQAEAEANFKRLSGMPGYKTIYGIFLYQAGRKDEGVREFERLLRADPNDRNVRTQMVSVYWSMNRQAEAQKILDEALKKNAGDLDALLQRAEIRLGAKNYVQSELDLNRVLHLQPGAAEVHYILGKLHQAKGEDMRYRQDLAKALELNSYLLPIRLELAAAMQADKSPQSALDLLKEAPEFQRQSPALLAQRNWAFWSLGNLVEMKKGIDQGLAMERSADLLIQNGLWMLKSGDPVGARKSVEEALRVDPSDLRALQALRQTYLAQKNAPLALQKVKEYAATQPKSAPVQDFLGLLLMSQGTPKEARTAFAAAKAADPAYMPADLALIQMDIAQGDMTEAKKRLEAILTADRNNPTAQMWLGIVEEKRGDRNTAIELYRKVAQANPAGAQALNNLAYLLSEVANKPDEALKYAQEAVQLAPEKPAYCDTLGWILYRKGVYNSAVQYLERAGSNNADKDNVVWKYHLAMAYAKAGDLARGKATLEAALKLNPSIAEAKMAQAAIGGSH